MLFMSFVVAVAMSQLRASPRKGSKLLLQWMCGCHCLSKEGLDCNNCIADIMVVLPELYMSSMFESSTCSIDSSWVWTDGCWSRECSNCHVLACCLLKAFQWCSRLPREMCCYDLRLTCWVSLQNSLKNDQFSQILPWWVCGGGELNSVV